MEEKTTDWRKEANESGEKVLFPTTSGRRHVVWRRGVVA
jgi:hypothetical protein